MFRYCNTVFVKLPQSCLKGSQHILYNFDSFPVIVQLITINMIFGIMLVTIIN